MSLFAKIMVVVNFFLAVAFLAAAGTLLGAAEDWKKRYEDSSSNAQQEITALKAQVDQRDKSLTSERGRFSESEKGRVAAEANQKTLQDSNKALETANTELRRNLETLATAQKDLQGKNAEQSSTIDKLRNDLNSAETARREVESKYRASSEEVARLSQSVETAEKALAAQQAENTTLNSRLDELSTTISRYQKEKGQLTGAMSMKPVNGVVQAVSNKDDIYVLSVGRKDGVEEGYEFTVYRGSEYISTVVIDKVFEQYSSGRTKPGTKRKDVVAGDEATTQL
jgi:peptidoglycan hydrolase CwlO-like protein